MDISLRWGRGADVGVTAVKQAVADGVIALDESDTPRLEEGIVGDGGLVGGDVGEGLVGALS